jgi:hypothetical protein
MQKIAPTAPVAPVKNKYSAQKNMQKHQAVEVIKSKSPTNNSTAPQMPVNAAPTVQRYMYIPMPAYQAGSYYPQMPIYGAYNYLPNGGSIPHIKSNINKIQQAQPSLKQNNNGVVQ